MQQFNLKQLREKKGFTQSELADKANVSRFARGWIGNRFIFRDIYRISEEIGESFGRKDQGFIFLTQRLT